MRSWVLFVLVLVPVVGFGALWYLASRSARLAPASGLVEGRLRPLPRSPNAVSSEEDTRAEARVEPLTFAGSPADAQARLVALLESWPRVTIAAQEPGYVHAVCASRLFGFRDDLELRLDEDEQRVHVRSAARVGRSDLGANRRRVETLRERWMQLAR